MRGIRKKIRLEKTWMIRKNLELGKDLEDDLEKDTECDQESDKEHDQKNDQGNSNYTIYNSIICSR